MDTISHDPHDAPASPISRRDFLRSAAVAGGGAAAVAALPHVASARVAKNHCGWGAFPKPRAGESQIEAVRRFENLIGRKLDVTRHYLTWDSDFPNEQIRRSAATGHMPLISLECQRRNGSFISWSDIAHGHHDRALRAKARAAREWGKRAYLVFNHEPENDPKSGNAPEFRAAYNHARRIFNDVGAHNLRWVCTLMAPTYGGAHGGAGKWVPSGATVLGVDAYNRGGCSDNGWQSFETIFGPAHRFAKNHGKRLVIQEWATVGRTACGKTFRHASKAGWIDNACRQIKQWSNIEAVIYTHGFVEFRGHRLDFRVNETQESLRVYRRWGHDQYFS